MFDRTRTQQNHHRDELSEEEEVEVEGRFLERDSCSRDAMVIFCE
jgi:hypothetical protein